MLFLFNTPKSLSDFERDRGITSHMRPPAELRTTIKIAVIDDQPFAPEHNLKNNRFNIQTFLDIQQISQVQDFPIVLCDLQGVGVQLAADLQGAYLIEEIKSNYPEKVVIAYTGGSTNSLISRRANAAADGYLKKDASIEDWRDLLDLHIKNLSDPVHVWREFRLRLVRAGIVPYDLMLLEDAYVKSIKEGSAATRSSIENVSSKPKFDPRIRKEVVGFLASKAFDLVFEALKDAATQ